MSASLRNHHCLTQEEIRQYVQRHAALAEAEAAAGAGGESAESGDESSQTGSASATTTNPMTMTVLANRTLADPLTVEDVTAGAARVTETAEALEALEAREEGTPTDVVVAQEIEGIEEVENPTGAVVVEETIEQVSGVLIRTTASAHDLLTNEDVTTEITIITEAAEVLEIVETREEGTPTDVLGVLKVVGTEGLENSTETEVTGISTRMAAGRHDLLTFALIMLAAAGVGCLLCVVATSCCLARAERVLRGGQGGGRGGSVRQ